MAKLAQLLDDHDAFEPAGSEFKRAPRLRTRFYAFLSYSHQDKELADWLHRELERFRVPHSLAGKLTANGVVPRRLTPIFRDQHDLSAGGELADEIKAALAASQFLVVLCSPTAAKSRWTNAEIESFKRTRPEGCVLAAIAAGEPFASDLPGREEEECFPPALRYKFDRRGRQTVKRAEPLAADFRAGAEGQRTAFLKLVAGMLGVGLDELVQRETTRRHRQLAWVAAASLAGMAATSTLAVTAIQARNAARDQRREAEGLVSFMLGDLKDKLEPIGRLDALDGVGSRVLAYYSKQNTSELSDAALLQRSRALSLTAQVSYLRGDLDSALRLYREAIDGTGEAIRRNPDDPQRLFDHAQNFFYIGEIARQKGDAVGAESAYRMYKRLAERMVALDPDNMKWRMEEQYADVDVGIVLYAQRRFREASAQFGQALQTIEALATADPHNSDYQKSVADSLAWLADAQMSEGRLGEAIATRQRHAALLNRLLAQSRDVAISDKLVQAHRALGNLYVATGQLEPAVGELREAVAGADSLLQLEPKNRLWLQYAANARVNLAEALLATGNTGEATTTANAGCALASQLVARDSSVQQWRVALRDCQLMRVRLALVMPDTNLAVGLGQQTLAIASSIRTNDVVADRFALARAHRLLGDAFQKSGALAAAQGEWDAAIATLPKGAAERPAEMNERATILQRLNRTAAVKQIEAQLRSIGYHRAV
jgi:eukaryotic-like serine/threonine-protein kinase